MNNSFERRLSDEKSDKSSEVPQEATFSAQDFFDEHGQAIEDYAEDAGIVFRRGERWAIDMERGEATYDPKFFSGKGYSSAEAMLATCHEIEHFRDWRKDPEGYAKQIAREMRQRRLKRLYNSFDDILVARSVYKRFPAHRPTNEDLYKTKLFPSADFLQRPKHLQFSDAILRERILPDEIPSLSPEVRVEIEKLKNIDGEGTDLITLVSDPEAKPADRFEIIRNYIEPIYEKFFREDVEERKNQEKAEGGGEGEEGVAPHKKDEDYFKDDYDDYDSKMPEPFSIDDIKDVLDKEIKRQKAKKAKTPEQIANEQFEKEYGVSVKDVEQYRADYEKIKQYIEPLREIFERIISKRKEIKRRLKERAEQGVILDPSMISQAYIDAQSGILDSRTQLKIKKEEYDENKPNNFEFTLVCDLSGSMNENQPGGKSYEQRLSAVLISEALAEFEEKLRAERLEKNLDLHVLTEVRGFGDEDEELKPLSDTIDYKSRIKIANRLADCNGGSTQDFKSLAKIDDGITEDIRRGIKRNDLKKIILMITDGGSDDVRRAIKEKKSLLKSGVVVKAIQIGEVGPEDEEKFREVWWKPKKDGFPCRDVSKLVPTIEKLLEDFLDDL